MRLHQYNREVEVYHREKVNWLVALLAISLGLARVLPVPKPLNRSSRAAQPNE